MPRNIAAKRGPLCRARLKKRAIAVAHFLESVFEPPLKSRQDILRLVLGGGVVRLEPELRERWHQRSRQDIGGQHREHDRLRQRHEQKLGDARQQEHRNEHDADRQGRTSAGNAICCAPVENRCLHVLAVLEMLVDVLDGDGRIIHQDAHREREAAQGHDVDRLPQRRQATTEAKIDNGIEMVMINVLRQLPRNSRIISPVSARGDQGFADHSGDGGSHEDRLIAERLDFERRGQRRLI